MMMPRALKVRNKPVEAIKREPPRETRKNLMAAIEREFCVSRSEARSIVNHVIRIMARGLIADGRLELPGIGTLRVYRFGTGRNRIRLEPLDIP